jgi:multidrug efflux pump subunit AcrA (membrane-fusion protein)
MYRIAAAALTAGLLASCGNRDSKEVKATQHSPVAVTVATVSERELPTVYEAVGTVRAKTSSVISSRMTGYIRQVHVGLGDQVKIGQVLITLDSQDTDSQIRQAEAALAEVHSVQPEIESAVAAAKAQLDLTQTTFARMQDLFGKKSISNQEFDEAAAKVKVATANYNLAESKRSQLSARVEQAEQAIRSAKIAQSYATITAPFAGTVTEKPVESGILASPGTPLLTIEQAGALRLEASVEESRLAQVRVGQTVAVVVDAVTGPLSGRVTEIVPSVDSASRTFLAKIDLPQRPQLRPGQFGRARFSLGQQKALTIPTASLSVRGQLQMVYVIDSSGLARSRMVTTGAVSGQETEVLSGLSAGESIVSPLTPGVADGARVEVRP